MQIVLFDNKQRDKLYPFTSARAVAGLKFGMFSLQERWELFLQHPTSILTTNAIQPFYNEMPIGDVLLVDAAIVANEQLANQILKLQQGHYLAYSKGFIAGRIFVENPLTLNQVFNIGFNDVHNYNDEVIRIDSPLQLLESNSTFIEDDFKQYTAKKQSKNIDPSNTIVAPSNIFIEEGATITCSILNAINGPIYIGKNATIMEGSIIRGPFVLGENSVVKMGSKIYGGTTIGSNCVVGGEIKNTILHNFSNKAHDGYLGDSIIGEWCNFGAGTSNSNIKNTAGEIKLFNDALKTNINAGIKCGVLMGHYTRVAINSSINTGSVFGISCNVFGNGLLPKSLSNFTWGTEEKYEINKAIEAIENWQKLKNQAMSEREKEMIEKLVMSSE
jgi:UDP-N-acetylglucosamine diphosphorylase/glucosamine-1-phosphate N-acetyltransferase